MTGRKDVRGLPSASGLLIWMGFLSLILWARIETSWALAAAVVFACTSAIRAPGSRRHGISALLLAVGVAVGLRTDLVDRRLTEDWQSYWDGRRDEVAVALDRELSALVVRGDSSVARVVAAAMTAEERTILQDSLGVVVDEGGMAGAAVYGPDGRLVVWAGGHRGRFPKGVLEGAGPYSYFGTPLFSYLYFTAEIPGGLGTAVVVSLMHSDLPEAFASGLGDFVSRFREETGERIRIARSDRVAGPGVFDYEWPDEALLSFTVQEPDPLTRRSERRGRGINIVIALAALVWLLASFGGPRRDLPYSVAALFAAAVVLPLEGLLTTPDLVDPAFFRLFGPFPLPLGRVLMLCVATVPLAVLVAPRWERVGSWLAPPIVALGFPTGPPLDGAERVAGAPGNDRRTLDRLPGIDHVDPDADRRRGAGVSRSRQHQECAKPGFPGYRGRRDAEHRRGRGASESIRMCRCRCRPCGCCPPYSWCADSTGRGTCPMYAGSAPSGLRARPRFPLPGPCARRPVWRLRRRRWRGWGGPRSRIPIHCWNDLPAMRTPWIRPVPAMWS